MAFPAVVIWLVVSARPAARRGFSAPSIKRISGRPGFLRFNDTTTSHGTRKTCHVCGRGLPYSYITGTYTSFCWWVFGGRGITLGGSDIWYKVYKYIRDYVVSLSSYRVTYGLVLWTSRCWLFEPEKTTSSRIKPTSSLVDPKSMDLLRIWGRLLSVLTTFLQKEQRGEKRKKKHS